jgi:hypothetical protein
MHGHFLPVCYLKGFLDPASEGRERFEPFVWVRDATTRTWKERGPRGVAKLPDYYGVSDGAGGLNNQRENALGVLETVVTPLLRRLPHSDELTGDEANALLAFAGTMHLRQPLVHAALEKQVLLPHLRGSLTERHAHLKRNPDEFRRDLEQHARESGNPQLLDLRLEDLDPAGRQHQVNRQFIVDRAFAASGQELLEALCEMRWLLLRAVVPATFITSDMPVHWIDLQAPEEHRHYLRSPGVVFTLPLTKEVMLLGDRRAPPGMSWGPRMPAKTVRFLNGFRTGKGVTLYSSTNGFLGEDELLEHEAQLSA